MHIASRFQSTPLKRGETCATTRGTLRRMNFNPLPSHEGRPSITSRAAYIAVISIHSPLTRGDHLPHGEAGIPYNFNPLPSCEGRPVQRILDAFIIGISIHSPLTRGDASRSDRRACRRPISIHSPHTRGDCPSPCRPSRRTYFNPLPSREGRHLGIDIDKAVREFQSTPLMRGETHPTSFPLVGDVISIHSPHTRGDRASDRCTSFFYAFQSAPLM